MKVMLVCRTVDAQGKKGYEQKRFNSAKNVICKNNETVVVETDNHFYTFKQVGQIFIN